MIQFPGDYEKGYPTAQYDGFAGVGGVEKFGVVNGSATGMTVTATTVKADWVYAGNINATQITAGYLSADRIESGSIDAKIASIGFAKITDVVITNAMITSLDAGKIQSGTLYVGNTSQCGLISIRRNGTNGYLTWEGGNKIWSDNDEYMGFQADGERFYFYTGATLYCLMQRGSAFTTYVGISVNNGGIELDGDCVFGDTEHHVRNIDGLVGSNDIRYVLGNNSYYHSFCNASWNEHAWITAAGSLDLDGNFSADGTKSFKIPHPLNSDKFLIYNCPESPEVALKIRGTAKLVSGRATVQLPDHWAAVTEATGLTTVQLTPLGQCAGLCAPKDSATTDTFVVEELNGGTSNTEFAWEMTAIRKGYLDFNPEPTNDELLTEQVKEIITMEKDSSNEKGLSRAEKELPKVKEIYKKLTGKNYVVKSTKGGDQ